MADKPIR